MVAVLVRVVGAQPLCAREEAASPKRARQTDRTGRVRDTFIEKSSLTGVPQNQSPFRA
jgi:hypothetical protein